MPMMPPPARTRPRHGITVIITAGLAVLVVSGVGRPGIAAEPDAATASVYVAEVAADRPLGQWPLDTGLEPRGAAPPLEAGDGQARFRPGPLAGSGSIDLGQGDWLRAPHVPEFDADEFTAEMIFQIKYPKSGTLCGIRDGGHTRFSLHYTADSPVLKLWNGSQVVDFTAERPITLNDWHHVAVALSGTDSRVWLDGRRCDASVRAGLGAARGLPFLVGCSDVTGKAERAEILAAHLAIHPRRLDDQRIAARVRALGWADRLEPRPRPDAAAQVARTAERVARIERDHGVKVRYEYGADFLPAPWRAGNEDAGLSVEQMPRVLDEIEAFLAVVPTAVSRRDLETIHVVARLRLNGSLVGALASGRSIYLCCDRPVFDIRCSLYHELSHILQVAHPVEDGAWQDLLPAGFHYLGAEAGLDPFGFDDGLRNDGFILRYSTTNRHEDIAVLSDWMFVRKQQAVDLCERYPAIRSKLAFLVDWYRSIDPDYEFPLYEQALRPLPP